MKLKKNKIYILDGAMGTELQRRKFNTYLPLWSARALFEKPRLVKKIHKEYIQAGADIITTNTFRTQRRTLAKVGLASKTKKINELAVKLAKQAVVEAKVRRKIYIAGSLTALEDCYEPKLVPPQEIAEKEHLEQVKILAKTPIDFFLLETFNTIRETEAAAKAVAKTRKDMIISFTINKSGNLRSGEKLKDAVARLNKYSPLAYMVNCAIPSTVTKGLQILKSITSLPVGVYANGTGQAGSPLGWSFVYTANDAYNYFHYCFDWKEMGAKIIGGCCGTTPEYTKLYSKLR